MGFGKMVQDGDKAIRVDSKEKQTKYKEYKNIKPNVKGGGNNRTERYRIPPLLIQSLLE